MTDVRPPTEPSMPLARLLAQARAELNAQPAPPMPRAMFEAVPATASPDEATSARRPWWAALTARRRPGSATPARRASLWHRWPTVAAACSVMLVSVTVLLMLSAPPGGQPGESGASGFIPVAPQERWSRLREDGGAAWVVTTELPQARLASYGLPFDPAHAADTVRAELLMRASGEVLAVRILD